MAQTAPPSQDLQDIQFKLHDRFTIFSEGKSEKSLVSLLAISSTKGLLFAGNPNNQELKVFKLKDIVDAKTSGHNVKVRVENLPSDPKVLACSCDGSLLAVNYVLNNNSFLVIFNVESFLTPTINPLYNIPVAPESNAFALQLLWNPVISNNIALILIDGSVAMFTFNNNGQYDKVTLGKEHQVKSGCWSPKGKQIVFGFAEGKLQQFKPNLQPARAISCPAGVHQGPFDCIALHWLSTFQFAAIFLQRGQDMCPSLYIVSAPKTGQPSYVNYYDVCYSAPGPRIHQFSFNHIAQWNILLVTSANGVEVGVLGTKETGETPNWIQYTLLDEARIEMPLTETIDETYPLGFALDTSSSHQVVIGENKLPVMPMIHILSTHGHLMSYNFLNLSPTFVGICSPPPPLNDISGRFVPLSETISVKCATAAVQPTAGLTGGNTSQLGAISQPQNVAQDMTFTLGSNVVTSTPAVKDKPGPFFNPQISATKSGTGIGFATMALTPSEPLALNKPSTGFSFAAPHANTAPFPQQFDSMTTGTSFGGFASAVKTSEQMIAAPSQQITTQSVNVIGPMDANKALYTVQSTFAAPTTTQQPSSKPEANPLKASMSSNNLNLNTGEIDNIVKQMIFIQIQAFEMELNEIRRQSSNVMKNIGSADEMKSYTKQLNDLQEIVEQAKDREFERDVQTLRYNMNESYAMLAECRTKLELYNNPDLNRISFIAPTNPTSRRQLAKLKCYVAGNQNQLYQLNQLIDGQWCQYQDVVRRNSKNQMHIPCLDGIYQRMSKLKDLLYRQRTKLNYIKTKLREKGLNYKPANDLNVTSIAVGALTRNQSNIESLADSMLSMSLSQVVSQSHAKLSKEKLDAIRNFTKRNQQITIIKPRRPDRVGLNSEVILETKLETERQQKEIVKKQQQQQQQQQLEYKQQQTNPLASNKTQQSQSYQTQLQQQLLRPQVNIVTSQQQQKPILAKPTASKPSIVPTQPPAFITPATSTSATFSFGGNSSFVKTSLSASKSEETPKPTSTSTPFAGFGNFSQSKLATAGTSSTTSESKEQKPISAPISFSAKVIGGNDAKPFANLGTKTVTLTNLMQPASQGFSAFATTKPALQTSSQDKDKKAEDNVKPISFATAAVTTDPTTTAPAAFTSLASSSNLFGANTAPFTALSTSSTFSFNATVATSTTTASTAQAIDSTKAVTTTTAITSQASVAAAEIKSPPAANTATTPAASTSSSSLEGFSFNSPVITDVTASGTKSSAVPNVTIISGLSETRPAIGLPTSPIVEDPTDALLDSLNICKPSGKETGKTFTEIAATTSSTSTAPFSFVSASAVGEGPKPFSSLATSGTTSSTGFSFVSAASGTPQSTANIFEKPTTTSASSANVFGSGEAAVAPTSNTSTFSFGKAASTTVSTADSLFGSLSVSSSTAESTTATSVTSTATSAAGNIFRGGSSLFGQTATTTATSSLFSGGAVIVSSTPSLFGSTAPTATTAVTPGSGSLFAAAAATSQSGGSIFGGIPKPEESVFSSANTATQPAGTGLFASAAATSKGQAAPGGSIFGGVPSMGFGGSTGGSIFGGGSGTVSGPFSSTVPANTSGSIFAAAATKEPAEGANIFSSPTQQSPTSGGSIFGKSTFGATTTQQSPANIFGGGNVQAPTSGGFGSSGGSIFGGSAPGNTSSSGGSIFGAAAATTAPAFGAPATSSGFGSFSQPSAGPVFGSPVAVGFGAPASTGFGSPQQQSAFAKPVFGGPAAFGSPQPAFGGQATFGGGPTFGSPKGFGSFAATSPNVSGFGASAQGSAAPKGNIFETLGSQDSGLSFGNLAHSTQAPPQKPSFGGSSFMNYRS